MKITRLPHSCLLIERDGVRLLIDPGDYSFAEKLFTPESLRPIDAVLITHNHSDHCDSEAIKKIGAPRVIGTAATSRMLGVAGVTCETITPGQKMTVGSVSIEAIQAPHDPRLTAPAPESVGYVIGDVLLHPGDSLNFDSSKPYTVLALPIAAPWMVRKEALDLAVRLKPKKAIPIHDGMFKDFARDATYALAQKYLQMNGVEFVALKPGEVLEV